MPNRISRRAFVSKTATAAGTMLLHNLRADSAFTSFLRCKRNASVDTDEILDVAIVGGGVSGIYSGWRLLIDDPRRLKVLGRPVSNGRKLKVTLFEGSRRIGGRLLSARPPGMSTICELGGMRFVSAQKRVVNLVKEVKLPHHRLYTFDPNNHVFIRGKHLRSSDLNNPSLLPYNLTPAERECVLKHGPDVLITCGISSLLPGVANLHGEELYRYLQTAEVDGTPLYRHGFWNLLARTMSPEAYMLSRATIGFDTFFLNVNAVDQILDYLFHTPDVTYQILDNSYDALPWALQEKFEGAGGQVVEGAWLSGFRPVPLGDGSVGVQLDFRGPCQPVKARAIILAMPKRSLELILPRCPVLNADSSDTFQALLNSAAPVPLCKVFICYSHPWWEATGVCRGESITDLPIRQCWYWTESQHANCGSGASDAIIMAYNDGSSVDFWAGLRPSDATRAKFIDGCRPKSQGENNDVRLRDNWNDHSAPAEMVAEMHRQLLAIHNVRSAPEPVRAAYADWSDDPFGGGAHVWNQGAKSWSVVEQMTQPVPDFPCFVCGEAYSTIQGWVEGALETAEIVLQKRLGLSAPPWLPA
jgi:monoamine oxidase